MYRIAYAGLVLTWVVDVLNIGALGAVVLDVQYPINWLAWLLIWIFLPPLNGGDAKCRP